MFGVSRSATAVIGDIIKNIILNNILSLFDEIPSYELLQSKK
jgi:hypothetical protein